MFRVVSLCCYPIDQKFLDGIYGSSSVGARPSSAAPIEKDPGRLPNGATPTQPMVVLFDRAAEDGRASTEELPSLWLRHFCSETTPTSLGSYHTTEPTLAIH